ncbi:ExbD/TolR family protein [Methylohalobius crimeensis]|uniref:ExbD/TolR family protein n=1 Tax=Methylohalobius crimeensis TaxID=244365 RepID=UPI0003B51C17|nr:biopolymer transporter ExbD [Methylohalobius crimeensis]
MNFRRHRRERIDLSLTPMIDVVFLLLIFFMVTTSFERDSELKIELPEAQSQQRTKRQVLEVAIDASGRYYIDRHELVNSRIETLKKALREALKEDARPVVVISADRRASHQAVIRVLDAARQLQLTHISFATQNATGE